MSRIITEQLQGARLSIELSRGPIDSSRFTKEMADMHWRHIHARNDLVNEFKRADDLAELERKKNLDDFVEYQEKELLAFECSSDVEEAFKSSDPDKYASMYSVFLGGQKRDRDEHWRILERMVTIRHRDNKTELTTLLKAQHKECVDLLDTHNTMEFGAMRIDNQKEIQFELDVAYPHPFE
jgi:hypothetical protein